MIKLILLALLLTAGAAAFAQEMKTERNVVYGQAGGHDLIMHVTELDDVRREIAERYGVEIKPKPLR